MGHFTAFTFFFAATIAGIVHGSGFMTGKDYVYRYHGYMFTNFPKVIPMKAGMSFKTNLIIQHKEFDTYMFKFDDFKVAHANEIAEKFSELNLQHEALQELGPFLERPFKVRMREGKILSFEVNKEEPFFLVNIKRGLLTFFDLNLSGKNRIEMHEGAHVIPSELSDKHFKVMESGVFGECETIYDIASEPYFLKPQHNHVLNVTKTRNYDKCTHTPYRDYTAYHGHDCVDCEADRAHPLHNVAVYHYDLRGDRYNFLIEKAFAHEVITYNPFTLNGQVGKLFVNRSLELMNIQASTEEFQMGSNIKFYNKFFFEFPVEEDFYRPVDLKAAHFMFTYMNLKFTAERMMELFRMLTKYYEEEPYVQTVKTSSAPAMYLELIKYFQTMDFEDIKQLYQMLPDDIHYRRLFFNALGDAGTNPAFAFATDMIENKDLNPDFAKDFIGKLSFHFKEYSDTFFTEFLKLCKHPNVARNERLERTCFMTFSSLLHDACVRIHHRGRVPHPATGSKYCEREYIKQYLHHFEIPGTPGSRNDYRKLLNIRVLGNMGVRDVIPMLKPYIYLYRYINAPLRSTAIFALSRVAQTHPEEVVSLLMPVFLNETEDHEIRLASFIVIMQCHPELHMLEHMAKSLYHEHNHQVISMVYHTLEQLSKSEYPCHRKCAKDAKFAFRFLKKYTNIHGKFHFGDSKNYIFSGYDPEFDFGGFTQVSYIMSNTSYVPRNFYVSLNDYLVGQNYQTLSFGFQQRGLEKYLDRFFQPKSKGSRQAQGGTGSKELKEIDERLHIMNRDYEPLHLHFFGSMFGEESNFFYFNDTHIQAMMRQGFGKELKLDNFEYHRFMLRDDIFFLYPTEFGLPVMIDFKAPEYIHFHSKKFEFHTVTEEGSGSGIFGKVKEVSLTMDGAIEHDEDKYISMAVVFPSKRSIAGIGVQIRGALSLPIQGSFKYDLEQHKFSLNFKPVKHDVYFKKVQPYLSFDSYTNVVPVYNEEFYKPIHKGRLLNYERHYFHDFLGFGFDVKGKFEEHDYPREGDFLKFLMKKDFRDYLYYNMMQPQCHTQHYTVTLTPANRDLTNEVGIEIDFDDHHFFKEEYTPYTSEYFGQENEYFDASRTDRFTHSEVMRVNVVGKGAKERRLKAEFEYTHSRDNLYHRLRAYYERTPFFTTETQPFKICLDGKMKFPNHPLNNVFELKFGELDHKVDGYMDISFGENCESDKKIRLHAQFDRTEEQIHLEQSRSEPLTYENYNAIAYTYQKCMADRQRGHKYSIYCDRYLHLSTQLRKADITIQFEKLTDLFKNNTYKFDEFLKFAYYPYLDNNAFAKNEEGKIHIEANMTVAEPATADVRIFEPHENTFFTNIPVVISRPISTYPLAHHTMFEQYSNYFEYPYCAFEADHVRTFDNVTFKTGITNCFQVLAKDCSPNKFFTILSNKLDNPNIKKSLKMFIKDVKIEILPVGDTQEEIVRVNGKKVPVSPQEDYRQYEVVGEKKLELFRVSFNRFFYTIESQRYGVFVFFDHDGIYIQLSRLYLGKVFGLCGSFNLEKQHELMGPEGCVYSDPVSFGYSYAIPEDTCTVPEIPVPCVKDRGPGCTLLRNRYVYVGARNRQMCFTTVPLPECAEGCEAHGTLTRRVGFHCLAAKDDFTRSLQKESQRRVLTELAGKSEDHYAEVEYPESCHRSG